MGWFWDEDITEQTFIDVLESIDEVDSFKYIAQADGCHWQHFRPLTPEEIEKYTGYKVLFGTSMSLADNEMQANGLGNNKM
ncbi:MAG: hypothetical protein IKT89_05735 [Clostridia bacterium]|nr:hypothetical protein [Clostridia bacterium]